MTMLTSRLWPDADLATDTRFSRIVALGLCVTLRPFQNVTLQTCRREVGHALLLSLVSIPAEIAERTGLGVAAADFQGRSG